MALGHRHCPLGERVARLRSQRVDPSSWPSSCLEYWVWDGSPVRGPRRSRGMALGRKAPGWCAALGPSTSCVHPWASSGDLQCSSWWSRAYPRRRWLIGHLQWPATTPRSWRSWVDRSRKSVAMRRQANLPRPMEVVVEIDPAETSETRGSSLGGEALGEETATGGGGLPVEMVHLGVLKRRPPRPTRTRLLHGRKRMDTEATQTARVRRGMCAARRSQVLRCKRPRGACAWMARGDLRCPGGWALAGTLPALPPR